MIYVEFIRRRPDAALPAFHRVMQDIATSKWEADHPEDVLLLNIARTWRLGPEPEYLTVWMAPGDGLARIDAWDRIFRSGEADDVERSFRSVATIERAGCYTGLRATRERNGIYYAEFFEPRGSTDDISSHFLARESSHMQMRLALLALAIGKLAPPPGGIAVWTAPSFQQLSDLATFPPETRSPFNVVSAGTYVDVGMEIL